MIHLDALDFSECRSAEVMFLLALSVYMYESINDLYEHMYGCSILGRTNRYKRLSDG